MLPRVVVAFVSVAVVDVFVADSVLVVVVDTVVTFPPPKHWHTWQNCVFMFEPQQSPLSKPHCTILLTSSQYPSPLHTGFGQPTMNFI